MKVECFLKVSERVFRNVCQKHLGIQNLISKIGFLNVIIKRSPNVSLKLIKLFCYMYLLQFPETFINLCHACDDLESNAQYSRFGVRFITVRNTHVRYMIIDFVPILYKV